MLKDEEILALDYVLVRDNETLGYISYDGGWGGAGNTNTTAYTDLGGLVKPIQSFVGQKIEKPRYGTRLGPQVAAIVEDILYLIVGGKVERLHLFESHRERREIDYDTYETSSISPVSDKVETIETDIGIYTGTVVHGKPEGKGQYNYFENDALGRKSVTGFFIGGKSVRYATIEYKDGGVYVGTIKEELPDAPNGGKYTYPTGEYYIGGFSGGVPHGMGILYSPDGEIKYDGRWKSGKPKK